jgi:hypothetical protein
LKATFALSLTGTQNGYGEAMHPTFVESLKVLGLSVAGCALAKVRIENSQPKSTA